MKKTQICWPHRLAGFSLIELITYIGLISISLTGAILFGWDLISGQAKSNVQLEVQQNLRLASKRIGYELKNASGINSLAVTDLCLVSAVPARNPTRIYLSAGRLRIAWGGGSANCTNLINDEPLTSNLVTVSTLAFTNRSNGAARNVSFAITVNSTSTRQEWQHTQTYQSSVELR